MKLKTVKVTIITVMNVNKKAYTDKIREKLQKGEYSICGRNN